MNEDEERDFTNIEDEEEQEPKPKPKGNGILEKILKAIINSKNKSNKKSDKMM